MIAGSVPLCLLFLFLVRVGNSFQAEPYMLMERIFNGVLPVLLFVAVNLPDWCPW